MRALSRNKVQTKGENPFPCLSDIPLRSARVNKHRRWELSSMASIVLHRGHGVGLFTNGRQEGNHGVVVVDPPQIKEENNIRPARSQAFDQGGQI